MTDRFERNLTFKKALTFLPDDRIECLYQALVAYTQDAQGTALFYALPQADRDLIIDTLEHRNLENITRDVEMETKLRALEAAVEARDDGATNAMIAVPKPPAPVIITLKDVISANISVIGATMDALAAEIEQTLKVMAAATGFVPDRSGDIYDWTSIMPHVQLPSLGIPAHLLQPSNSNVGAAMLRPKIASHDPGAVHCPCPACSGAAPPIPGALVPPVPGPMPPYSWGIAPQVTNGTVPLPQQQYMFFPPAPPAHVLETADVEDGDDDSGDGEDMSAARAEVATLRLQQDAILEHLAHEIHILMVGAIQQSGIRPETAVWSDLSDGQRLLYLDMADDMLVNVLHYRLYRRTY